MQRRVRRTGPLRSLPARAARRVLRSRLGWLVVTALVGVASAQLAVVAFGTTVAEIGPVQTRLTLQPSVHGDTAVQLPPLGALRLDTHDGPFRVDAQVLAIDEVRAQRLVADPGALAGLEDEIAADARAAVVRVCVRSAAAALLGGVVGTLLVLRRWRAGVVGAAVALAGLLLGTGSAAATWRPEAITQPTYEGLLTFAPSVVGDAQDIVTNFDRYREQLAKVVGNVSQLYLAGTQLPAYDPDTASGADGGTVRLLLVSDLHLNPAGFDVIESVAEQFQADLVVDAGDITDHGSAPEGRFVDRIGALDLPYVFVRGNHDSLGTERAVEEQPNAVVLRDGETAEVAGLRIAGAGDPRFTPDKNTRDREPPPTVRQAGERLRQVVQRTARVDEPPQLAVVHDPEMALPLDGVVPLVLAGHGHQREQHLLDRGTRVFEQGSTGGAGLRGLEQEQPTPVQLSVLYLDRGTGQLLAWDDIDVGGLGLTSAEITRHLADEAVAAGGSADGTTGP